MINPFDYLFYKLAYFQKQPSSGIRFFDTTIMAILLFCNIITISHIAYREILPAWIYILVFLLVGILVFSVYTKKRYIAIKEKFDLQSENSSLIGNAVVVFYIIITIVAFIMVVKQISR